MNDSRIHSPYCITNPAGITPSNALEMSQNIIEYTKKDGALPAGKKLPSIKKDHYRVALAVKEDGNYHYLRENQNGQHIIWSQKFRRSIITTMDDDERVIINPDKANLGEYKITQYFHVPTGGIKTKPLNHPNP